MTKKTKTKEECVSFRKDGRTEKVWRGFLASCGKDCAVCGSRMEIAAFRIQGVLEGLSPVFICSPQCVILCMDSVMIEMEEYAKKETTENAS